ncbi:hypothetical protein [Zhongshania sp.]|uniref:hypothetical protein n=1 Tax=Zhongshania sp. TaxID=1971902 RepID=UPI003561F3B4
MTILSEDTVAQTVAKEVAKYTKKKERLRKQFMLNLAKLRNRCRIQLKDTQNAILDLQGEAKELEQTISAVNEAEKLA